MVLVALVGLCALSFWLWHGRHSAPTKLARPSQPAQAKNAPVLPPTNVADAAGGPRLEAARATLAATTAPEIARKELDELRRYLSTLPPPAAVAAIRQFLDARQDVPTGLGFAIGPDGFLTGAPSLRIFLLDYLAQVDRPAAGRYAESILGSMDSPGEWAVSLRNYALANATPEGRAFLEQKMQELLGHEPWQSNPSAGYLEAFDVAVHLGGTNLMPALTQLLRQTDNHALAHAAYLALDRLTLSNPAATLEHLLKDPSVMQGREQTRANYFARADVSDPQQRQILESYLLAPDRSATELQTFAGLFPNANFMISHNLLTSSATPDHQHIVRRDQESLRTVNAWLADPRFNHLQLQIQTIQKRLSQFVEQARSSQ